MNAAAHQLSAGTAVGFFLAHRERREGIATMAPIASGVAASIFTRLPDILEPATSPNHRQFFHSLAFGTILVAGYLKLRDSAVTTDATVERVKGLVKLAIAGYLIHLALDATTAK